MDPPPLEEGWRWRCQGPAARDFQSGDSHGRRDVYFTARASGNSSAQSAVKVTSQELANQNAEREREREREREKEHLSSFVLREDLLV